MKKLSIILPMYNEEEMIPLLFEKLFEILDNIKNYSKEIVCVNDGSKDRTLELLKEYKKQYSFIHIVSFSRNFGHEAAVAAGFDYAKGDAMIVMDSDLQDPPEVIYDLLKEYEKGYKVVNAKRVDRHSDSLVKRKTAEWYYKIIRKLSGKIKVPDNVGNFRLLDREVVDTINALPERNRVFRVIVPYVGFKTATVEFVRAKRPKGKTHYNYKSMFKLAGDSIVSSSVTPLKYPMTLGMISAVFSFVGFVCDLVLFILHLSLNDFLIKFDFSLLTLASLILLMSSLILISLGIMCEYLARMMIENQDRPNYIVEEDLE